jgi:hypothetical protein
MLKNIMALFCLISIFQMPIVSAANGNRSNQSNSFICAPQLQKYFNTLQKLPEVKELMTTIQKDGPVRIAPSNRFLAQEFGAFWDPDNRIISVSLDSNTSEGEIISAILFEMHNASVNSKLNHLDELAMDGKISKESYVRGIENLEYINSKNAAKIADKGIALGIFPKSTYMMTYNNFEEHYYYQKVGGHSACIAKNYDMLTQSYFALNRR